MATATERSARAIRGAALLWLAALVGCGGTDGDDDDGIDASINLVDATGDASHLPDAEPADATFHDETCPQSYGPASVAVTFMVGTPDQGFDLDGAADPDGDGQPDNILGSDDGLRNLLNVSIGQNLDDGSMRQLTELRDFDGLGSDDPDATMVLYGGIDSDVPAVTGDDFNGDEDYYFDRLWVDYDDCSPKAVLDASYTDGVVTATADLTMFYVASLGGFLDIARARLEASIVADTKGARTVDGEPARFGGAMLQCPLASGPGFIGFSAQQDLANVFDIQPDIDLDGDGLETVQADSAGIISCTDGDGTVITGELCGCDPRMADGYSIVFVLDTRGAAILGPAPL